MNKKSQTQQANLVYNVGVITIITTLIIVAVIVLLTDNEQEQNNNICQDLGYDEYVYKGDEFCLKNIGFDKQTGKKIECYMPFEFKLTAEEWC
jgi:hypothetical protein